MGISFQCPHCRTQRLAVWFANPLDGGPPAPDKHALWLEMPRQTECSDSSIPRFSSGGKQRRETFKDTREHEKAKTRGGLAF
jgi:hypothetical protein